MKRVDSFLLRSYLGPFLLTFFIALFILLMQFVWKYVDDLVGKGLEWSIILELLGLVSVTMVSLALPLAILLSSLMTFGNLGEFMELTALKASGISLRRAMQPVFIFCLLMSTLAFYFSNNVLPVVNLKMRTLLYDIQQKRPELNIQPGIFNNDIQDYVIRIGKKSRDGKQLEDIMIYDHSNRNGNDRVILAERGKMSLSADKQFLELQLFNGRTYTEAAPGRKRQERYPFLREHFKEDLVRFDLSIFKLNKSDENLYKKNYQMLNLAQLEQMSDSLSGDLVKEKALLSEMLLPSPFFRKDGKYQTEWNGRKPALSEAEQRRQDSLRVKMELQSRSRMALDSIKGKSPSLSQPLNLPPLPSNPLPVSGPRLLKDRKEVLNNFTASERMRILSSAENLLRSGKSTLEFSIENLDQAQERIFRYKIEWHRKFTLSVACVLLFLIGAPLGAIVRKGGLGMPVVFSLIFFVAYHMISITGEKLAREGVWPPVMGMWLSTFVLLPVGFFLTRKATSDSSLFDLSAYTGFFQRLAKRNPK